MKEYIIGFVIVSVACCITVRQRDDARKEMESYKHQYELSCATNASILRVMRFSVIYCPAYGTFLAETFANQQATRVKLMRMK